MDARRAVVAVITACAAAFLVAGGSPSALAQRAATAAGARPLLPDLDQETPSQLVVEPVGSGAARSYVLGFRSAVRNIGDGPLILDGARADTATPFMSVTQVLELAGGSERRIPNVGRMAYVASPDHSHWHYLQFDRYALQQYELRRAKGSKPLVLDQKTGFCLGDRYRVTTRSVPHAAPDKVYRSRCGLTETQLLKLREGISAGYGDDYKAFLEGQDLPLSGLPDGRYLLVHRVNGNSRLRERSYANNAASLLLDLRWRDGVPLIRVLRSCPDSNHCPLQAPRAAASVAPFIPDDAGAATEPGGWKDLQWNFAGTYGVGAPDAWANLIRAGRPGGAGVIVAVVDTGVAYADQEPFRRSPDLAAATFTPGYDFVDYDAYPFDRNGHGTHVASTIAEQTNNGYGLTGLAYGVRIMPVRVLDEHGDGYPHAIASGIRFAADHHAQVINLSLNFGPFVTVGRIQEVARAIDYAYKRGALVVAASGNESFDLVALPARARRAVAVGATTEYGCVAEYSNWGEGIDLVAPGGGSDANLPEDLNCHAGRSGGSIHQMTFVPGSVADFGIAESYVGTSMATAHVSAAAALVIASRVLGRKPKPTAVLRRLQRTARDLGAPGYDRRYGWGLVNAAYATAPGRARRPTTAITAP
jgi:serine protease